MDIFLSIQLSPDLNRPSSLISTQSMSFFDIFKNRLRVVIGGHGYPREGQPK